MLLGTGLGIQLLTRPFEFLFLAASALVYVREYAHVSTVQVGQAHGLRRALSPPPAWRAMGPPQGMALPHKFTHRWADVRKCILSRGAGAAWIAVPPVLAALALMLCHNKASDGQLDEAALSGQPL